MKPHFKEALLISLIPAIAQTPQSSNRETETLSVCTVLANIQKFNGKVIAVRGLIEGSGEGTWIVDDSCTVRLMTNSYRWPNAIAIEFPTALFLRDDWVSLDLTIDYDAIERLDRKIKRMNYNSLADRLWLTYVGLFETKKKLEVAVYPDGRLVPLGFGHLGGSAGRLLIKTARDPVIEHRKKPK